MGAPTGNTYWQIREKDGRDRLYDSPSDLLDKANEYFQWCVDNPIMETQVIKGNMTTSVEVTTENPETLEEETSLVKETQPYALVEVPRMRPYTKSGLCGFLGVVIQTFENYKARKDFLEVCTRIEENIYNQKFEGAASNQLNHNIIARDLGLTDKKEVKTKTPKPVTFNIIRGESKPDKKD